MALNRSSPSPIQSFKNRSAQALVEYILLSTIVTTVVLGVFWPAFNKFSDEIRRDLFGDLKSVLSQESIGIPLSWFGLERYAFKYDASSAGNPNGGPNGNDKNKDKNAASDSKTNPNSDFSGQDLNSVGGGGGSGRNSGKNSKGATPNSGDTPLSNDSASNEAKRKKGDSTDGADGEKDKNKSKAINRDQGAGTSSEEDKKIEEKTAEQKENGGKLTTPESGASKLTVLGRKKGSASNSCQDIDLFTLIKIAVILGILVLLAAIAISAKGKKGGK